MDKKGTIFPKLSVSKTLAPLHSAPKLRNVERSVSSYRPFRSSLDLPHRNRDLVPRVMQTLTLSPLTDAWKEASEIFNAKEESQFEFTRPSSTEDEFCDSDCKISNNSYSERAEISETNIEIMQDIEKDVSKRVITGMVLTTKCGQEIENISQKHLKKRIDRFLEKPVPISVITPHESVRFPRVLAPPLTSQQLRRNDLECSNALQVTKAYGKSLKIGYLTGERKCRYIRAPLSPIPTVEWVFESRGKCEQS